MIETKPPPGAASRKLLTAAILALGVLVGLTLVLGFGMDAGGHI